VKLDRSGLFRCPEGPHQRLELFAALTAHLQVLPDQRHSLGGIQAGDLHLYKEIYLLEALVAADLLSLTGVGYLLYERSEDVLIKQFARSFFPALPIIVVPP